MARTLTLTLLLALLGSTEGTQAAPGPPKVVIAQGFVGGAAVSLQTAKQLGLFEKYGIAVEIDTMNSTQAIQSLIAGKVQVMFGAPAQGLAAVAAGEHVRSIATLGPNMPYLVLARKPITLISQLRGKRLGVSAPGLSADRTAILLGLKRLGLNPRTDTTMLVTGTQPMRVQALGSGTIDGTVLEIVYRGAAERAGAVMLADLSRLGVPWDQDVILVMAEYGRANTATVENVLKAILESNAFILNPKNRAAMLPIIATAVGLDEHGDAEAAYDLERRLYVTRKPYPTTAAPQTIIDELKGEFPDLARVDANAFVNPSFVRRLDTSGFIDRLYAH
jgi:ABC-type nitrate/sulfonate/bicarbonate transport system substrate-binding protein